MKPPVTPADEGQSAPYETELQRLRAAIDEVDSRILEALNVRATVVSEIYRLKQRHGVVRLDQDRTRSILDRLAGTNSGPLNDADVRALYEPILRFFVERFRPPP